MFDHKVESAVVSSRTMHVYTDHTRDAELTTDMVNTF